MKKSWGTGTSKEKNWYYPGVNFINVLRAHFSYKSSFKSKTYLEKKAFVRKIRAFNFDEIDHREVYVQKVDYVVTKISSTVVEQNNINVPLNSEAPSCGSRLKPGNVNGHPWSRSLGKDSQIKSQIWYLK